MKLLRTSRMKFPSCLVNCYFQKKFCWALCSLLAICYYTNVTLVCNFLVFNILFTHQMISYDPCLDFFLIFILLFLVLPGHIRGKKNPNQSKCPNPFQAGILASDNVHLFPPYWKICRCTWINRNWEQSWLFSKVTTSTKSIWFIKSCEIKAFSDFSQKQTWIFIYFSFKF